MMNIGHKIVNLKIGDTIIINEWQHRFTVCGVSEKHVLAVSPKSNEYTIIPKEPTFNSYNSIPAGSFVCGADFWIFGYAGGYHFDDPAWISEYLTSLSIGETEVSVRHREQIRRILVNEEIHE